MSSQSTSTSGTDSDWVVKLIDVYPDAVPSDVEMGGFETAFLDRLIYARNRKWLGPLESMLAENRENMVIVGAAHLRA